MKSEYINKLSMRERQILDIILEKKQATVKEVLECIPDAPSYSTVRALMNIMKDKGYLKHKKQGLKYIYFSSITHKKALKTELKRLLQTHFNNSMESAVAALIDIDKNKLKDEDFKRLHELIDKAKTKGN